MFYTPEIIFFSGKGRGKRVFTVNKFPMEDSHSTNATDKLEILKMVFIRQARHRIDLQCVIITTKYTTNRDVTQSNVFCIQLECNTHMAEYSKRP